MFALAPDEGVCLGVGVPRTRMAWGMTPGMTIRLLGGYKKENDMKVVSVTLVSLIITVTQTLAARGGGNGGGAGLGPLATFFAAFCVLIVLLQLVPGIRLFAGMLKGLFSRTDTPHETVDRRY